MDIFNFSNLQVWKFAGQGLDVPDHQFTIASNCGYCVDAILATAVNTKLGNL